jgi:hypothetical protein
MLHHVKQPQVAEVCKTLTDIIEARSNPLFSIIKRVEPATETDHLQVLLPLTEVSPSNRNMAGGRLAKAIAAEFGRAHWSTPSCVASLALQSEGTLPAARSGSSAAIDISQLSEFLSEQLTRTGLRPSTINLVTVTFEEQWNYLSLICPKIPYGERRPADIEGAFRQLRQELLDKFDIRLRVVVTTPRRQVTEASPHAAKSIFDLSPHPPSLTSESSELTTSHLAKNTNRRRTVTLSDWSALHLCSIDSKGTRRFEDLIGEGTQSFGETDHFDLRVCVPLPLRDFQCISPEQGIVPMLGVQAHISPSGAVPHSSIAVVEARNAQALEVNEATSMLDPNWLSEDVGKRVHTPTLPARKTRQLVTRLPEAVARIRRGQDARREVASLQIYRPADPNCNTNALLKAQVLVQVIMRFAQSCILTWRDQLPCPPALLVSRPAVVRDAKTARLASLAGCCYNDLIDPALIDSNVKTIRSVGGELLVEQFAQVVHDAHCNRKLHLVYPNDVCIPGDILPLKRGRFGYINNLQMASATLGLEPLASDLLRCALSASNRSKLVKTGHEQQLSDVIRTRQRELLDLLF